MANMAVARHIHLAYCDLHRFQKCNYSSCSWHQKCDALNVELLHIIVYCLYIHIINVFVVSSCILVSCINKLKKWLFYIYLLTTITKALYQSSEKGMSLLFTCPQLTVEESLLLAAAARMWLLSTAHIM